MKDYSDEEVASLHSSSPRSSIGHLTPPSSPRRVRHRPCGNCFFGFLLFALGFVVASLTLETFRCSVESMEEDEQQQVGSSKDNASPLVVTDNDNAPSVAYSSRDHAWCPFAKCIDSNLCQPCRKRYLIVIANARSGSTTMLDTMNQLPGVRLSGENNNAMAKLHNSMFNGIISQQVGLARKEGPWGHEEIHASDLACPMQATMNALNPPPAHVYNNADQVAIDRERSIVGFKTVRFTNDWPEDVALHFLVTNFPCSRVVINYSSDTVKEANSIVGTFGPVDNITAVKQGLEEANQKLLSVAEKLGDKQAFVMDTKVYNEDTGAALAKINSLVEWLGFRNCTFPRLMHANMNHAYGLDYGDDIDLGDHCHYAGDWPSL